MVDIAAKLSTKNTAIVCMCHALLVSLAEVVVEEAGDHRHHDVGEKPRHRLARALRIITPTGASSAHSITPEELT